MLDCHSPNEDMFLHFCRQMAQICPHLCCFLSILKTTPKISSLASFYSSRRKCTERLGASLYALVTFRATSNAIQGRFLSGCGEVGPSLCRKSTWGYPLSKITPTLSPRYVTWIMHKRIMFAYTWTNQWSLAFFNGQNFRCAASVSEEYRPYRHKGRTLFFITSGRWQSKALILSTNADQKSIETGFSIVICRPIGNRKHLFLRLFSRSSIVKSVFNCRLPGMFNLNTAPALCIARCCFVFKLWVNNSSEENYNCNCRYPEREIWRLGSQIVCFL